MVSAKPSCGTKFVNLTPPLLPPPRLPPLSVRVCVLRRRKRAVLGHYAGVQLRRALAVLARTSHGVAPVLFFPGSHEQRDARVRGEPSENP